MKKPYTILQDSIKQLSVCFKKTFTPITNLFNPSRCTFMCIEKGFAFLLLFLIPVICMNTGEEVNKDIANYAESQNISHVNNLDDFAEEDTSFDISDIYGHWVIGEVAFRDITSVTKDGRSKPSWSEKFVGSIIEYKENAIIFENISYEVELNRLESDYFYDCIKTLTMIDSVCFDFMEKYNLNRESKCFFVSYESPFKPPILPDIGRNFIVLDKNHILFWLNDCFFDGFKVDINNLDSYELPTPPKPADPLYIYGKWIVEYALDGSLYVDESDIEQYIGTTLEYQKNFIVLGDVVYDNPQYAYDVPLPEEEFKKWFPHVEDDILLNISYFYSQYIFIDGMRLNSFGEHVYYVDEENILVFHNYFLYRAKRV